jgi:hypothetical protein
MDYDDIVCEFVFADQSDDRIRPGAAGAGGNPRAVARHDLLHVGLALLRLAQAQTTSWSDD